MSNPVGASDSDELCAANRVYGRRAIHFIRCGCKHCLSALTNPATQAGAHLTFHPPPFTHLARCHHSQEIVMLRTIALLATALSVVS